MVKFIKPCGRYNAGDTAVFSEAYERRLINDGFAAKKDAPPPQKRDPEKPQDRQITVGPQKRK